MNESLFLDLWFSYLSFYLRRRERLTNGPLKEKVGTFFVVSFYSILYNEISHFGQTEKESRYVYLHCRSPYFEIQELNFILLIFSDDY